MNVLNGWGHYNLSYFTTPLKRGLGYRVFAFRGQSREKMSFTKVPKSTISY